MANTHSTLTSLFTDIADAIRTKTGSSASIVADNFPSAIASIPSGGGASNVIVGEFNTGTFNGARMINTGYTGSGYIVALLIWVKDGTYASGTDFYNLVQRYAIASATVTKSVVSSAPTYTTSGANNYGTVSIVYKSSASSATSYSRSGGQTANTYSSSSPSASTTLAVRIEAPSALRNGFSVYVNTTSYGFAPSTDYSYVAVYSE